LQLSPANDAAGQLQESFMDKSQALEPDTESTEVMKPGDGPLYDPAGFAQTAAMRLAASCYLSCNTGSMQRTTVFVVIVASVALNDLWFREWSATFAADRRDGFNQCVKLGDIVTVGARQYRRERDTLRFGNEVVL
jgi:hypothetical protein